MVENSQQNLYCPQCGTVMKPTPLTSREIEVLRAYSEGLTTKEISESLFVSVKTVEAHRQKILLKTGAPNMIRAVVLGIKQKVVLL
jgi:DNA-binding NarL/FixJ family response regulator